MTPEPRSTSLSARTTSDDPGEVHPLLADGAIIISMTDTDDQARTGFRCTVTLLDRHGHQHVFASDRDLLAAISEIGRCCTGRLG